MTKEDKLGLILLYRDMYIARLMVNKFGEGCEVVILFDFSYLYLISFISYAGFFSVCCHKENHCTYTFHTSSQPFL